MITIHSSDTPGEESMSTRLHRGSLALHTDLYQLTMAQGYWKVGALDWGSVFHHFFRRQPFGGGYTIACGLETLADFVDRFRFEPDDLEYLGSVEGNDGEPMFAAEFLEYLGGMTFDFDIDAVPEGTLVFPHEPLVRVRGPLIQCQLLETPLLNLVNYQSLIATKASRIAAAAQGDPVLEFGLRRAHGLDGGLSEARAAYVGGCTGTSNVLAGKHFGIPIKGTHAHSWVMAFASELESFEAYAEAMPNNCVFLVDTYDSLDGVRHAIEVGEKLRERGYEMAGVRLDSGDLAALSIEARELLDEAGFPGAAIVASNDLDEHRIAELKERGAAIGLWGVGTRLATAHDDPHLTGVYKLSAVKRGSEGWDHQIKLSEQPEKSSNPGIQQIRRFHHPDTGRFLGDMIWDEDRGIREPAEGVDVQALDRAVTFETGTPHEDLLRPLFREGELVAELPPLSEIRERALSQLERLGPEHRKLAAPDRYPVGLEQRLWDLKQELARELKRARS